VLWLAVCHATADAALLICCTIGLANVVSGERIVTRSLGKGKPGPRENGARRRETAEASTRVPTREDCEARETIVASLYKQLEMRAYRHSRRMRGRVEGIDANHSVIYPTRRCFCVNGKNGAFGRADMDEPPWSWWSGFSDHRGATHALCGHGRVSEGWEVAEKRAEGVIKHAESNSIAPSLPLVMDFGAS
jgi:hypothetical protein